MDQEVHKRLREAILAAFREGMTLENALETVRLAHFDFQDEQKLAEGG